MKVIYKGDAIPTPGWAGKTATCSRCKWSAVLDSSDNVEVTRFRKGSWMYQVKCPNCDGHGSVFGPPSWDTKWFMK